MTRYTITNPPTGLLKLGDEVLFTVDGEDCLHVVNHIFGQYRGAYLKRSSGANERIFDVLCLDKIVVCGEAYGYKANKGRWPETKSWDFAALTRLVWKLYGIIAAREASTACPACNGPEKAPSVPKEHPEMLKVGDWAVCLSGISKGQYGKVVAKGGVLLRVSLESGKSIEGLFQAFKRIEPWERFKEGDRVEGKEFGFRKDAAGVIFQFDPSGSNNSHWGVETDTGERYWLLDDTIERVIPEPAFRAKGEGKPAPNVTEIYLEQDGDDVNICASRNGFSDTIAYIRPGEKHEGKGKLHLSWAYWLDQLQLVEGPNKGIISIGD